MEDSLASREACARQELTEDQKSRTQRNRERAQALKEQRRREKPYDRLDAGIAGKIPGSSSSRDPLRQPLRQPTLAPFRNSHAGFMYEEEEGGATQQLKYRQVDEDGRYMITASPTHYRKVPPYLSATCALLYINVPHLLGCN